MAGTIRTTLAVAGALGAAAVALSLNACILEDVVPTAPDAGFASSGIPGSPFDKYSSSSSSGQSTSGQTTSSSSSSGAPPPPPPPPPPTPIPGGCFVDGKVLPAGPAPTELPGDCYHDSCDGVSKDGVRSFDANDAKKDDDPCLTHTCTTEGPKDGVAENGKACGTEGGVCFKGKCTVCKPTNATSCAAEGGNEPANDSATTATAYSQFSTVCAYSSDTDVDWYTFYAKDASLSHDVFNFDVWSTAPTLEVCIFVKCGGGSPGGCGGGKPGPDGSYGCCWSGVPSTLKPRWDLDCSGTSEDSGTAYVSVRTPGGDTCEPYLISGGY